MNIEFLVDLFFFQHLSNEKSVINCINSSLCHELFYLLLLSRFSRFLWLSTVWLLCVQMWMVLCLYCLGLIWFLISVMLAFKFGNSLAITSSHFFFSLLLSLLTRLLLRLRWYTQCCPTALQGCTHFPLVFFSVFFRINNFHWFVSSSLILYPTISNLLLRDSSDFFISDPVFSAPEFPFNSVCFL